MQTMNFSFDLNLNNIFSLRTTAIYFQWIIVNLLLFAGVLVSLAGSGEGGINSLFQVTNLFYGVEESSVLTEYIVNIFHFFVQTNTGLTDLPALTNVSLSLILGPGFITFSSPEQAARHSKNAQRKAERKASKARAFSDSAQVPHETKDFSSIEAKLAPVMKQRLIPSFYSSLLSYDWIAGFVEASLRTYGAEGGQASFSITQHLSDWYLLVAIKDLLGAGRVTPIVRPDGRTHAVFTVTDKVELKNIIIPLLEGRIRSEKKLIQFNNWRQAPPEGGGPPSAGSF